jgi:hypothetical protein
MDEDVLVPPITDEQLASVVASYLNAAFNKIDVAEYHNHCLTVALGSGEAERVEVQASFEGILYAGVAATDQVAEVLNRGFELQLNRPNLKVAVAVLRERELDESSRQLVTDFATWLEQTIVKEAALVRVRATHHYYPKEIRAGLWIYEASDEIEVSEGGLVGDLTDSYVGALESFRDLIQRLANRLGVNDLLDEFRESTT